LGKKRFLKREHSLSSGEEEGKKKQKTPELCASVREKRRTVSQPAEGNQPNLVDIQKRKEEGTLP